MTFRVARYFRLLDNRLLQRTFRVKIQVQLQHVDARLAEQNHKMVTKLKTANDELNQAVESFRKAKQAAEAASEAKSIRPKASPTACSPPAWESA